MRLFQLVLAFLGVGLSTFSYAQEKQEELATLQEQLLAERAELTKVAQRFSEMNQEVQGIARMQSQLAQMKKLQDQKALQVYLEPLVNRCQARLKTIKLGAIKPQGVLQYQPVRLQVQISRVGKIACILDQLFSMTQVATFQSLDAEVNQPSNLAQVDLLFWQAASIPVSTEVKLPEPLAPLPKTASEELKALYNEVLRLRDIAAQAQELLGQRTNQIQMLNALSQLEEKALDNEAWQDFLLAFENVDPQPGSLSIKNNHIQIKGITPSPALSQLLKELTLPKGVTLDTDGLTVKPPTIFAELQSLPDYSLQKKQWNKPQAIKLYALEADPGALRSALDIKSRPMLMLSAQPISARVASDSNKWILNSLAAQFQQIGKLANMSQRTLRGAGNKLVLHTLHTPLARVLQLITKQYPANLVVAKNYANQTLSIDAERLPIPGLLRTIAKRLDLHLLRQSGTWFLIKKGNAVEEKGPAEPLLDFKVHQVQIADALKLLAALVEFPYSSPCAESNLISLDLRKVTPKTVLAAIEQTSGVRLGSGPQNQLCRTLGPNTDSPHGILIGLLRSSKKSLAMFRDAAGWPVIQENGTQIEGQTLRVERNWILFGKEKIEFAQPIEQQPHPARLRLSATITSKKRNIAVLEDRASSFRLIVKTGEAFQLLPENLVQVFVDRVAIIPKNDNSKRPVMVYRFENPRNLSFRNRHGS